MEYLNYLEAYFCYFKVAVPLVILFLISYKPISAIRSRKNFFDGSNNAQTLELERFITEHDGRLPNKAQKTQLEISAHMEFSRQKGGGQSKRK